MITTTSQRSETPCAFASLRLYISSASDLCALCVLCGSKSPPRLGAFVFPPHYEATVRVCARLPKWRRAHLPVRRSGQACSGQAPESANVRVSENTPPGGERRHERRARGGRSRQNAGDLCAGRRPGRSLGDFGYVRLRLHASTVSSRRRVRDVRVSGWRRAHLPVQRSGQACSGQSPESANVRVSENAPPGGERRHAHPSRCLAAAATVAARASGCTSHTRQRAGSGAARTASVRLPSRRLGAFGTVRRSSIGEHPPRRAMVTTTTNVARSARTLVRRISHCRTIVYNPRPPMPQNW